MSIRPVDMQIMIQKAPDVAKPVIAEIQHYSAMQQNIAEKFIKESLLNEERVLVIERTEDGKVDEDARGGGRERRNKKRNKRQQEDGSRNNAGDQYENHFDISI